MRFRASRPSGCADLEWSWIEARRPLPTSPDAACATWPRVKPRAQKGAQYRRGGPRKQPGNQAGPAEMAAGHPFDGPNWPVTSGANTTPFARWPNITTRLACAYGGIKLPANNYTNLIII